MRVYGSGKIIPPIKTAKNGDLLFLVRGGQSVIQVRAKPTLRDFIQTALIEDQTLNVSGELASFKGMSGTHYFVVMDYDQGV